MKQRDAWKPSKYVYKHGKLIASRDSNEVGIASRLITDLIAEAPIATISNATQRGIYWI